ncbi:eukaryotic initiation factor 4E domain-containing protein [Hirsutella rhossiliensis]|uniref:Eukaryotic initiation factor 4E domain-containing protein n=1 Tax=Hirsutella rhossiliensis TaxID=111463 RepID=A0A9P8N1Q6_9HYPO|nr:eukaryotic initiation factor 4E domain-containing protein [Hirsutella rhossiliensis]KAH0965002.1 eukaryotic initiation factor 4E domain-containing protein [Hirsutella rhossiliensis]
MSSMRPQLFTRGLSGLSQSVDATSPAEQRDDAKRNFLKTMRPLPTQHYWNVYFDRQSKDHKPDDGEYNAELEQLGSQIESVQDFWRYNNNTPVDQIKMRESIYLFKSGFRPVWEDRRNLNGGSWTLRVPKTAGPDVWTRVQLLAIGEKLQSALDEGDQLCGVGLSVRFSSHLITIWHRDSSKKGSIDGMLACVMEELPLELQPKPDNYFYKRHCDHVGFKAPPGLKAGSAATASALPQPELRVDPPSAG